jgi:hypothetical protein
MPEWNKCRVNIYVYFSYYYLDNGCWIMGPFISTPRPCHLKVIKVELIILPPQMGTHKYFQNLFCLLFSCWAHILTHQFNFPHYERPVDSPNVGVITQSVPEPVDGVMVQFSLFTFKEA